MRFDRLCAALCIATFGLSLTPTADADPCGMVPPIRIPEGIVGAPIARIGLQKTYVFHHDGVQTVALRPGFEGKVDEFGMLIPFPKVPSIRKIADDTFAHLDATVDPPVVQVEIYDPRRYERMAMKSMAAGAAPEMEAAEDDGLAYHEVAVLKQEAVGMYEVAVLAAGSPQALKRWMDENGFQYPDGMDEPVNDYVKSKWCFVAVKTKVGQMPGAAAQPGMRGVDTALPAGAAFDGHVQGMAFRFEIDEPVVPMRLSTFNEGDTHNRVYILADEPVKIDGIPDEQVRRQVVGKEVYGHLTEPLELEIYGGTMSDISESAMKTIEPYRDPAPYNGIAKDLIASDLLAARTGEMELAFEEREKELLNISESLNLRGPEVDGMHTEVIAEQREEAVGGALKDVRGMHLTVVDGDFPRKYLANNNLTFSTYEMDGKLNETTAFSLQQGGPWVSVERSRPWWMPY